MIVATLLVALVAVILAILYVVESKERGHVVISLMDGDYLCGVSHDCVPFWSKSIENAIVFRSVQEACHYMVDNMLNLEPVSVVRKPK